LSPFISALRLIDRYFILWLLIVSCIAYFFPSPFTGISPWIPLLLGVVMFGMGTTLSADDFRLILKQPVPVLIGVAAQYVIMPGAAFLIALLFRLPPDLAAGMILVGASPGGTASNVIVYLARGDVPLSVTMTTVSTLLAPIFTPLLMLLLADRWLPVEPWSLFQSIVQVVIVPVVLGILVKRFFPVAVKKATPALPAVSVLAIIAIVAGIIANGADQLLAAPIIFLAVMLHNLAGLALGYLAARLLRQDEARCRAISVEVGMQNSGLAVALATAHFNPIAALPGAIFSVWHNISGSLLAAYWGKKKIEKASASGMTADS
jgi:BASS family bile acid:Na+ symporter